MSWVLIDNTHLFELETDAWFDVLGAVTRRHCRPLGGRAGSTQVDSGGKQQNTSPWFVYPDWTVSLFFQHHLMCFFLCVVFECTCLKVYSCVIDRIDLFTDHPHAHITHINILKCTLLPSKLSDILLNVLKIEGIFHLMWLSHPFLISLWGSVSLSIHPANITEWLQMSMLKILPAAALKSERTQRL